MRKLFYLGLLGFLLFEAANVYFIMPMPGSQRMDSLDLAYFLHHWRWAFRAVFIAMMAAGAAPAFRRSRWLAVAGLLAAAGVAWMCNFDMAADRMFLQPRTLRMADAASNQVGLDKLVVGVALNGEARAYPIQFIGYHHQVRDTVGGQPVMVTYCTVCRTGRVFLPKVEGQAETFRLVGMDHFNAMLEDARTGSWWRQATGEAVAGPLRGQILPEIASTQASLGEWLRLHPNSRVMQPDTVFSEEYDAMKTYDTGKGRGKLTGTDSLSWQDKSWVVGVELGNASKAFDWNRLKQERILYDRVGDQPVLVALAADTVSFVVFERPDTTTVFTLENDTLRSGAGAWNLLGQSARPGVADLKKAQAYQEFWHSWNTFHPHTTRQQ